MAGQAVRFTDVPARVSGETLVEELLTADRGPPCHGADLRATEAQCGQVWVLGSMAPELNRRQNGCFWGHQSHPQPFVCKVLASRTRAFTRTVVIALSHTLT